jgi:hypothetical protein
MNIESVDSIDNSTPSIQRLGKVARQRPPWLQNQTYHKPTITSEEDQGTASVGSTLHVSEVGSIPDGREAASRIIAIMARERTDYSSIRKN